MCVITWVKWCKNKWMLFSIGKRSTNWAAPQPYLFSYLFTVIVRVKLRVPRMLSSAFPMSCSLSPQHLDLITSWQFPLLSKETYHNLWLLGCEHLWGHYSACSVHKLWKCVLESTFFNCIALCQKVSNIIKKQISAWYYKSVKQFNDWQYRGVFSDENRMLFLVARKWNQPRCPPSEEWTMEMEYMPRMEYYSA